MSARRCVLATGNRHKLGELAALLQQANVALEVVGPAAYGEPPEIAETGADFVDNALLKARGVAAWLQGLGASGDTLVLADDSGLSVDALGGAPGVASARFAGEPCDDGANNRKLVAELRARGRESSPAHYTCVLVLVRVDGGALTPDGADHVAFTAHWPVEVRTAARGTGGFGYDPHAWLDDGACTVAELAPAAKAARSHRGQALRALLAWWQRHA